MNIFQADAITSKKKIEREEGEAKIQELVHKCEEIEAEVHIFNVYSWS